MSYTTGDLTSKPKTVHEFFWDELHKKVLKTRKIKYAVLDHIISKVLNNQDDYSLVVGKIALHIFTLQDSKSKKDLHKANLLKFLVVMLINDRKNKGPDKIIADFIVKYKNALNKKDFIENCVGFFCSCCGDCDSDTMIFLKQQIVPEKKRQIISEKTSLLDRQLILTNTSKGDVFKQEIIGYYAKRFISLLNDRTKEMDVIVGSELEKDLENIILHLQSFNYTAECLTFWLKDIENVKYFPTTSYASIKIRKLFDEELKSAYDYAVGAFEEDKKRFTPNNN